MYYQAVLVVNIWYVVNPEASPDELSTDVAQTIIKFIQDNPPLWQQWKAKRDGIAVEAGQYL